MAEHTELINQCKIWDNYVVLSQDKRIKQLPFKILSSTKVEYLSTCYRMFRELSGKYLSYDRFKMKAFE